ncbi:MAG TPA: hypothetical protein VKS82_00215 [Streptosporangiaceae bacterium]|nr:hypothetical protein [Streptosporangiaceae bacterium]
MTVDTEAAETFLRLLAEAELRQAVRWGAHLRGGYPGSLLHTAAALATVGALDDRVADAIVSDMDAALALRHPGGPAGVAAPRLRSMPMPPKVPFPPPARPASGGPVPPTPAGRLWAAPAGQMFRLHDEDTPANLWVLSVVGTPDSTWCAVGAMLQGRARHIPYGLRVPRLRALDDRGGQYGMHFSGYSSETAASGWLSIHPPVPDDVRWIEFYGHLDTPRLRLDLAAPPTPAQVTVDPAGPASPGERLLDAIAAGMLTREADVNLGNSLDTIVAALTAAHALPPGSLAPSRLATLCQRALLDAGPGLVAALEAGELPAAGLPEPWTSVLVHSVRRHRPAAKTGIAPLAVVLPELDGIRFVLAGLHSEPDHSLLSVVAQGLPQDDHGHKLGFQWSQWFPWWIRDSAGQWHVAQAGGYGLGGHELATLHLRVVPPLPRSVTRLDVIITGRAARVSATVPVVWPAG